MTIMFFLSLVELYRVVHPILVTVPKCLIQNWEHELCQWAPKLYFVNYSSKLEEARDIIRRTEFSSFSEPFRPQIVLTTFDVVNCVSASYTVLQAPLRMVFKNCCILLEHLRSEVKFDLVTIEDISAVVLLDVNLATNHVAIKIFFVP